mmetsp:Transcript_41510/g.119764  ORF Transcript_41510/g.119764 Transcript_41510/m.119764 type:complete len:909 (-) Transcript_41510:108-2834(-)
MSNRLAAASSDSFASPFDVLKKSSQLFSPSFGADIDKAAALRAAEAEESFSYDSGSYSACFSDLLKKAGRNGDSSEVGMDVIKQETSKHHIMKQMTRTLDMVQQNGRAGVTRRDVMRVVAQDDSQHRTCVKLPMAFVYSVVYIFFYQFRYSTSLMYVQESMIRTEIGDAPANAETPEDIYRWLEGSLLPNLFSSRHAGGSGETHQELLAGVRLRTARGPKQPTCDERLQGDGALPCTPSSPRVRSDSPAFGSWQPAGDRRLQARSRHGVAREAKDAARRRAARVGLALHRDRILYGAPPRRRYEARSPIAPDRLRDGGRRLRQMNFAWMGAPVDTGGADSVYIRVVPKSLGKDGITSLFQEFRNASSPLIDESTLFLTVDFMEKNDETALLSVASVSFMFSRGGAIYAMTSVNSLKIELKNAALLFFVLWVALLFYLTVMQLTAVCVAARRLALIATMHNFEFYVDFLVLSVGWVIVAFISWELHGVAVFDDDWRIYHGERLRIDQASLPSFDTYWLDKIFSDTEGSRWIAKESLTLVAVYTVLLVLRFLIATIGHPRLALVVRTLTSSMTDLLHLLFVCMIVFLSYVTSGSILFGRRMEEFSTLVGSFGYCLQIVFQRQFDYAAMTQEDMFSGTIWSCSFVFVLVLIMVNLVLTMIFNNYGQVREGLDRSSSVFEFAHSLIRKLRYQSVWVSNTDLLAGLATLPVAARLNPHDIWMVVPDMPAAQLKDLWKRSSVLAARTQARDSRASLCTFFAAGVLQSGELIRLVRAVEGHGKPEDALKKRKGLALIGEMSDSPDGSFVPAEVDAALPNAIPKEQPTWVKGALAKHLHKQQEFMTTVAAQMEKATAKMEERGLYGESGFPMPRPKSRAFREAAAGTWRPPPAIPSISIHRPRPTKIEMRTPMSYQ